MPDIFPGPPHRMRLAALTAATVLGLASATALQAQQAQPASVTPPERQTVVTFNPFAIVALYLTGDVETKIAPAVTIGGGASIAGGDDFDEYRAIDAKIRYYPNEKALHGFSIAATLGAVSARDEVYNPNTNNFTYRRDTRATFGTDLSYQWLLGPKDRFVSVVGLGLKRLLGSNEPSALDFDYLPTARVNIGFAF